MYICESTYVAPILSLFYSFYVLFILSVSNEKEYQFTQKPSKEQRQSCTRRTHTPTQKIWNQSTSTRVMDILYIRRQDGSQDMLSNMYEACYLSNDDPFQTAFILFSTNPQLSLTPPGSLLLSTRYSDTAELIPPFTDMVKSSTKPAMLKAQDVLWPSWHKSAWLSWL